MSAVAIHFSALFRRLSRMQITRSKGMIDNLIDCEAVV